LAGWSPPVSLLGTDVRWTAEAVPLNNAPGHVEGRCDGQAFGRRDVPASRIATRAREASPEGGNRFPAGRERRPFRTGHLTWYVFSSHGPHLREGGSLLPVIIRDPGYATRELR